MLKKIKYFKTQTSWGLSASFLAYHHFPMPDSEWIPRPRKVLVPGYPLSNFLSAPGWLCSNLHCYSDSQQVTVPVLGWLHWGRECCSCALPADLAWFCSAFLWSVCNLPSVGRLFCWELEWCCCIQLWFELVLESIWHNSPFWWCPCCMCLQQRDQEEWWRANRLMFSSTEALLQVTTDTVVMTAAKQILHKSSQPNERKIFAQKERVVAESNSKIQSKPTGINTKYQTYNPTTDI